MQSRDIDHTHTVVEDDKNWLLGKSPSPLPSCPEQAIIVLPEILQTAKFAVATAAVGHAGSQKCRGLEDVWEGKVKLGEVGGSA